MTDTPTLATITDEPTSALDEPTAGLSVLSGYPPYVEDLLPRAAALIERDGTVPSRNRLMAELGIGAPKATILREALLTGHPDSPVSPGAPRAYPAPATYVPDVLLDGLRRLTEATEHQTALLAGHPGAPVSSGALQDWPTDATYDEVIVDGHPDSGPTTVEPARRPRRVRSWPVILLALPAFVAIWSGWVGLGELTGFGVIHPLPGIIDSFKINTAITLPIGVEAYASYAVRVWLSPWVSARARKFAGGSALGALALGAGGQIAYHLMSAAHMTSAPWEVTTAVSALPVVVVFAGSALAHLVHTDKSDRPSA